MNIRRRNARKPLLRITSDPILDDLLVMETCADGKRGEKGEEGEGCMGDDNPTGGEREGGKIAACAIWHGREEGKNGVVQCAKTIMYIHIVAAAEYLVYRFRHLATLANATEKRSIIRSITFARSNLNTQIHGSNEAGKVPSSL